VDGSYEPRPGPGILQSIPGGAGLFYRIVAAGQSV
jgi:hypothetical protein